MGGQFIDLAKETVVIGGNPIPTGLREIYYYITFVCNLRCRHCYVGDNLAPQTHANVDLILGTLHQCYAKGARKVTFLGGEPTFHPGYVKILTTAAKIGYRRIIVDTNGIGRYPVPKNPDFLDRLAVRFSIEGAYFDTHNAIRGEGTFEKTLCTLRKVAAEGVRAEVTFTLNTMNVSEIPQMVEYFTYEGVSEINFHFVSLMGNGKSNQSLGLTPEAIIYAQEQLEVLRQRSAVPLRYPKLLIHKKELNKEIVNGYGCRIFRPETVLIFPRGEMRRCPLEITPALERRTEVKDPISFSGCPLSWRLLPKGVPNGYVMTCISWKNH